MALVALSSMPKMLCIAPTLAQISVALTWLRKLGEDHGWPEKTAFGLVLSLDEVLTNIVTHAVEDGRTGEGEIRLICLCEAQGIVLRIEDNGAAFDPTQSILKPRADSVEDAEIGGHGLRLMRHYMKSIHYAREDGRNVLTLVAS